MLHYHLDLNSGYLEEEEHEDEENKSSPVLFLDEQCVKLNKVINEQKQVIHVQAEEIKKLKDIVASLQKTSNIQHIFRK